MSIADKAYAIGLPAGAGGLSQASIAICHQVTTLDRAKLTRRIGVLEPEHLAEVESGLRAAMDLDWAGPGRQG